MTFSHRTDQFSFCWVCVVNAAARLLHGHQVESNTRVLTNPALLLLPPLYLFLLLHTFLLSSSFFSFSSSFPLFHSVCPFFQLCSPLHISLSLPSLLHPVLVIFSFSLNVFIYLFVIYLSSFLDLSTKFCPKKHHLSIVPHAASLVPVIKNHQS